jgi:cyclopropane fatty-acyl-phospholipid synthase-like methyltransferase
MSDDTRDLAEEFDARYRIVGEPVMRRIEHNVTGSDYGATSYTTMSQADLLGELLELAPGKLLLDFGSGAGWPGIHLARSTGCDVVLVDMPLEGLRRAARRSKEDGVDGFVIAASAALPPLRNQVFDAATSSDVLC